MSFLTNRLGELSTLTAKPMSHGSRTTEAAGGPVSPGRGRQRLSAGGTAGNELPDARPGRVLIVLLAAIGVTIMRHRGLLWVHLFVGMLLIGPLALKLASTGYRFVRYYTRDPRYRAKGPPPHALRLIAPVVVLSTLVVFASGVALLFAGPQLARERCCRSTRSASSCGLAFIGIHLLGHLPTIVHERCAPTTAWRLALRPRPGGAGGPRRRAGRVLALAGALVARRSCWRSLVVPEFGPVAARTTSLTTTDVPNRLTPPGPTRARRRRAQAHVALNRWLIAGSVALTAVLAEVGGTRLPRPDDPERRSQARAGRASAHHGAARGSSTAPRQPAEAARAGAAGDAIERRGTGPPRSRPKPERPPHPGIANRRRLRTDARPGIAPPPQIDPGAGIGTRAGIGAGRRNPRRPANRRRARNPRRRSSREAS